MSDYVCLDEVVKLVPSIPRRRITKWIRDTVPPELVTKKKRKVHVHRKAVDRVYGFAKWSSTPVGMREKEGHGEAYTDGSLFQRAKPVKQRLAELQHHLDSDQFVSVNNAAKAHGLSTSQVYSYLRKTGQTQYILGGY